MKTTPLILVALLSHCGAAQRATDAAVEAEYEAKSRQCVADAGDRADADNCRNALKAEYGRAYDAGGPR